MSNYLDNGTVLPFGLLGGDFESSMGAFNKTYKNSALRLGIVVKSYDVSNPSNQTKLTTEYDVLVFEQVEDRGSSIITYRNCISAEGMGSIADFFERTLRVRQSSTNTQNKNVTNTSGQNGAVVLILCLDAVTEKAIIIGNVMHPDRISNLAGKTEYLEGEFNGCNIQINQDGSAAFTFKGATNNNGEIIDSSQGNTVVSIATDGSFQVQHKTIIFDLAKSGVVTIQAMGDINVSGDNVNITANGGANIKSSGKTVVQASEVDIQGSEGMVLTTVTDPVVDTIFGEPTKGVPTFKAGG